MKRYEVSQVLASLIRGSSMTRNQLLESLSLFPNPNIQGVSDPVSEEEKACNRNLLVSQPYNDWGSSRNALYSTRLQ